jgi:hypothetical protein
VQQEWHETGHLECQKFALNAQISDLCTRQQDTPQASTANICPPVISSLPHPTSQTSHTTPHHHARLPRPVRPTLRHAHPFPQPPRRRHLLYICTLLLAQLLADLPIDFDATQTAEMQVDDELAHVDPNPIYSPRSPVAPRSSSPMPRGPSPPRSADQRLTRHLHGSTSAVGRARRRANHMVRRRRAVEWTEEIRGVRNEGETWR